MKIWKEASEKQLADGEMEIPQWYIHCQNEGHLVEFEVYINDEVEFHCETCNKVETVYYQH